MMTSFNRALWKEDADLEKQRDLITSKTPEDEIRKLYPFRAKVLTKCPAYGVKEGEMLEYARVKSAVSIFPIECVLDYGKEGICPRKLQVNSTEVQLLEV